MGRLTGPSRRGLGFLFVVTLVAAASQADRAFSGTPESGALVLFAAFSIASVMLLWRLFQRHPPAE